MSEVPNDAILLRRAAESQSLLPQMPVAVAGGDRPVPPVHSERDHSRISPSKLKFYQICPAYQDDPSRETHPDTLQGTLCHEALESGDDSKLTEEQRQWVAICRAMIQEQVVKGYSTELREERLEITEGVWGYADLILLSPDEMAGVLMDYKFGKHAQEPVETNAAAQAYVAGLFRRYPNLQTVTVYYLYPRRDEIDSSVYTRADLSRLQLMVQTTVARANAADPERNPAPDVCQWCRQKATCPALHQLVQPIATRYARHKQMAIPPVADFSLVKDPQTWSRLMALAPVLEAMSDSIKRHAVEFRQQTGQEIPGYELRQRTGRKTIKNALLAWEVAQQEGLTQQEFLSAVDVSAKRLADAAGEKAPRGQKAKKAAKLEGKLRDAGCLEIGPDAFYLTRSK